MYTHIGITCRGYYRACCMYISVLDLMRATGFRRRGRPCTRHGGGDDDDDVRSDADCLAATRAAVRGWARVCRAQNAGSY